MEDWKKYKEVFWFLYNDISNKDLYYNNLNEDEKIKLIEELKPIYKEKVEDVQYISKRKEEYPSISDQLDLIYHEGLDSWKAKIKETKDKYPKPE